MKFVRTKVSTVIGRFLFGGYHHYHAIACSIIVLAAYIYLYIGAYMESLTLYHPTFFFMLTESSHKAGFLLISSVAIASFLAVASKRHEMFIHIELNPFIILSTPVLILLSWISLYGLLVYDHNKYEKLYCVFYECNTLSSAIYLTYNVCYSKKMMNVSPTNKNLHKQLFILRIVCSVVVFICYAIYIGSYIYVARTSHIKDVVMKILLYTLSSADWIIKIVLVSTIFTYYFDMNPKLNKKNMDIMSLSTAV